MHFFFTIIFLLGSVSLSDDDLRKMFNLDHPYMIGHIPSPLFTDPVIDNYGLPGMYQELKVELLGGSHQCFYQNLLKDSKFFVYFEVLKGSDKKINVEVIQPTGLSLKSFAWMVDGEMEVDIAMDGVYSICLDNRISHFSNKIVTLYLHSYFQEQWEKVNLDLQESFNSVSKFLASFGEIDNNVRKILTLGRTDSNHLVMDWYLIRDNNRFVQRASIFLCIFFVVVSCLQTMFVKKLFSTPAMKPRV